MTDAELWVLPAWTNPFMSAATEPTLGPWASPGRVSLAPELSHWDRLTWGAAVYAVRNPGRPIYALTVRDRLFCYLAAQSAAFWSLPDDPLDSTEWIRRERFRSIPPIDDPALQLRRGRS
ncbi:hypothetical protein [Nocardia brasiliensis]|uniref:hypothetical protein n=1 Tax=Nocardia brasiliensis TaxID=37326 RepID=UPI0036725655